MNNIHYFWAIAKKSKKVWQKLRGLLYYNLADIFPRELQILFSDFFKFFPTNRSFRRILSIGRNYLTTIPNENILPTTLPV